MLPGALGAYKVADESEIGLSSLGGEDVRSL